MNLSFRVQGDAVWASDDEGNSRRIDDSKAAELREWWERAPSAHPDDGLTAAVLTDLGQAHRARPRPTGRKVDAFVESGHRGSALGPMVSTESRSLAEILLIRRSERLFGPTSLSALATLLLRSGRLRDWTTAEDGYVATHRPTPSAGARHPFELLLMAGEGISGLEPGAYQFDPLRCALRTTSQGQLSSEAFLELLGERLDSSALPPAAVCLVGHLDRTLSRYPSGMSLVWRDAGALLQTLHLCAVDLGLRSCVVGTCGILYEEPGPTVDMGCLAIGGDLQ